LTNFSASPAPQWCRASGRLTQHAVIVCGLAEQIGFRVRSQESEVKGQIFFCFLSSVNELTSDIPDKQLKKKYDLII
jgi:hypothetical protein